MTAVDEMLAATDVATERARFISDARAMLDMLEANPDVPLPWQFRGQYSATGTDEEQRAEIDRVAVILDVVPEDRAGGGQYTAAVQFGHSVYVAVAHTRFYMDRYNEESRLGAEAYERLHGGAR